MMFTSRPFYTSHGYHMALQVNADGEGSGKGTHISVYAPIRQGEYDRQVKWPLLGSITFTLLNQLEDRNHHSETTILRKVNDARVGVDWGKPKFIAHSALDYNPIKNTQYLKDDTLYFRVAVEVDDHKPWLGCADNMII